MLKLKKVGLFLLGIMVVFGFNLQFTQGLKDGYPRDYQNNQWSQGQLRYSTPTVDEEEVPETNPIGSGSLVMGNKTKGILHLPQASEYKTELGYALALVKIAINWILGMLAFVAVIYVLYCGSLILSSGSDDKSTEKGKKGIKTASIAIAGIGLAWLIISAMIWFIQILLPESD